MTSDPFAPIGEAKKPATTGKKGTPSAPAETVVMPVPDGAPAPPANLAKLGQPTAIWTYHDAAGGILGYVHRYDGPDGKQFRPLTLWRSSAGALKWSFKAWPEPRPLYGLRQLAERPSAPVLIVEGEKAAGAAARLLPGYVVVASPNGSKSARKANWSVLRARGAVIMPDADAAGMQYARDVAELVSREISKFISVTKGRGAAAAVRVIVPAAGRPAGWDAADAEAEGMTTEQMLELIDAAVSPEELPAAETPEDGGGGEGDGKAAAGGRKRTPQRDLLIGLTEFVELWHDAGRIAYASFSVLDHLEHWPIRSREFRMWLSGRFYEKTGAAIGGQALEDGIRILEARAVNEGPLYECFTRVGQAGGNIYLDLGDTTWRAVEISTAGWDVGAAPPLKLLRSPSMRALPVPEHGYLIEELRRFVNVKTEDDFLLVVACIVAALRPRGPFPILVVNGEAGTGKSLFSRFVRSLVDPSAAPIRAVPRDDRDLVVSASNSWMLVFDNLSSVPAWLADALCRLATGSGFATRALHTDRDEVIFDAARSIILNGIPNLTDRADLADRSVTIHLRAISENERQPEDELIAAFEEARPRILGAILDAVSRALGNVVAVKLERSPRMADFVKWVTAAEPGLGWEPGAFLEAYSSNRHDVTEATFEADGIAVAIWKLVTATADRKNGFEGTAAELLEAINAQASEAAKKGKYWPQNAAQLGNRVLRAAPLLRAKGCVVERRHSGVRTITIVPPPSPTF
jgi:putative DNA primase/helicase